MDYFFDRCFDKKRLKQLLIWFYHIEGENKTLKLLENLKYIGFSYSTKSGLSIGVEDLQLNCKKSHLLSLSVFETQQLALQYRKSNITQMEYFQHLIQIWTKTNQQLTSKVIQHFQLKNQCHPLYQMAFSGARGNIAQVRQLVGMRGLMADPQGQILDFPIRSNFREGLTLTEYIISCYGARKGIVDTALRTATSGYLTRRLVDVAQHVIIEKQDCGSLASLWIGNLYRGKKILLSLKQRCVGRILAKQLITSKKKFDKNTQLTLSIATNISSVFNKIPIRSPLTCISSNSICQHCYGWNLATESIVSLGEAVGVLAAQSIGEPGTQLTMRTFHTGGVFSGDLVEQLYAPLVAEMIYTKKISGNLIRTITGKMAFLVKEKTFMLLCSNKRKKIIFRIPIYTVLFCKQRQQVQKNQLIAELASRHLIDIQSSYSEKDLYSQNSGQIFFENMTILEKKKYVGKMPGEQKYYTQKMGMLWILKLAFFENFFISKGLPSHLDLINQNVILQKMELNIEDLLPEQRFQNHFRKLKKQSFTDFFFIKRYYTGRQIYIYYKQKKYWIKPISLYKKNFNQYRFLNCPTTNYFVWCFLGTLAKRPAITKILNYTYFFYLQNDYRNQNYLINNRLDCATVKRKTRLSLNPFIFCANYSFWLNKFLFFHEMSLWPKKNFWENYNLTSAGTEPVRDIFLPLKKSKVGFVNPKIIWMGYTRQNSNTYFFPFLYYKIKKIQKYYYSWIYQRGLRGSRLSFHSSDIYSKKAKQFKNVGIKSQFRSFCNPNHLSPTELISWYCFLEISLENFKPSGNISIVPAHTIHHRKNNIKYQQGYFSQFPLFIQKYRIFKNIETRFSIRRKNFIKLVLLNSLDEYYYQKNFIKARLLQPIKNLKPNIHSHKSDFSNSIKNTQDSKFFNKYLRNFCQIRNLFNARWLFLGFQKLIKQPLKTCSLNFKDSELSLIRQMKGPFNINYIEKIDQNWHFSIMRKSVNSSKFICLFQIKSSQNEFITKQASKRSPFTLLTIDHIYRIERYTDDKRSIFLGECIAPFTKLSKRRILLSAGQLYAMTRKNLLIRKAECRLLTSNGILHIQNKALIKPKTRLFTMFYTHFKTGDIVQGIPKVEEFFEARQTRGGHPLFDNLHVRLNYLYNKYKIQYKYNKAVRKALLKLQQIIINEIQFIYTTQGVFISDKHIEIITRQMTSKVRILDGGSTGLLRGELVDLIWIEKINHRIKYKKIKYEPTILGITKTCLETNSFISAASFQETTRILMKAAIQNKMDFICGLKENVILGHLIPAGTGFITF